MISLDFIKDNKLRLIEIANHYHASNLRVFGSVARGENTETSDIDLLVHFMPGASLLDQVDLSEELGKLFSCQVDVVSDRALNKYIADTVLEEAVEI